MKKLLSRATLAAVALVLMLGSNSFSATEEQRNALKDQIGRYQIIYIPQDVLPFAPLTVVLDTVTGQLRWCFPLALEPNAPPDMPYNCGDWSRDDRLNYEK